MCIIAICLKRKLTDKELENCWASNKDGAGVGWADYGKTHYKKGFTNLAELKTFYSGLNVIPHVIHFRTGTSGGYSQQMTHPFIVDDNGTLDLEYHGNKPLLFHNGVIPDWKDMALTYFLSNGIRIPDGTWSDTRVLAVLCSRLGMNLLDFIYGKFAIIHNDGNIERYGEFIMDEGNYYSNSDYKDRTICSCGSYNSAVPKGDDNFFRDVVVSSKEKESNVVERVLSPATDVYSDEEMDAMAYIYGLNKMGTESKEYDLGKKQKEMNYIIRDNFLNKEWKKRYKWLFSRNVDTVHKNDKHEWSL